MKVYFSNDKETVEAAIVCRATEERAGAGARRVSGGGACVCCRVEGVCAAAVWPLKLCGGLQAAATRDVMFCGGASTSPCLQCLIGKRLRPRRKAA